MKTKSIIYIALAAILLISIAIRETGLIKIDFYKSNTRLTSTINWKGINTSEPENEVSQMVNKNDLSIVILSGRDTLYKKINKFVPIVVKIDKLDSGPLWFPLYKSTNYSAVASTSLFGVGYENRSNGLIRHLEIRINIIGRLNITGICSHRKAKEILYKSIVEKIAEDTRNKFAELPKVFFTGKMKNSLAMGK
ncbi:hypothetical protein [Pedobacter frigoris]|uniref:hypothetical protein n=1 Tax=Pedobacter frigoris TaxID=2571272 RepID=UPI00292E830D|nr:hypothetical protein [Pedobacter frigoris]